MRKIQHNVPARTFFSASYRGNRQVPWLALVIALLLSLGWGIQTYVLSRQRTAASSEVTNLTAGSPQPALEHSEPERFEDLGDATHLRGLETRALLGASVMRVDAERGGVDIDDTKILRDVIRPQTVTVVNLWATWCEPCKDELAVFSEMFRSRGWRDEIRFVPILVDDLENIRSAYRQWGPVMPPHQDALIDRNLDRGGIRHALSRSKLLKRTESLPITLLIDCRRKLRWSKVGALDEKGFASLADEVDVLRRELRTHKCRAPTFPPERSTP